MSKSIIAIANHESIEVLCTGSTRYNFSGSVADKLQNKYIVGVSAQHVNTVTNTPLNNAVVNDTVFRKAYLTLQHHGEERVTALPFPVIQFAQTVANGGYSNGIFPVNFLFVDFYKSFISVANATGLVANEAFLLNFYYVKEIPAQYKPLLGFNV